MARISFSETESSAVMDELTVLIITALLVVARGSGECQEMDDAALVTPDVVIGEECDDVVLTCHLVGFSQSQSRIHHMFSWSKSKDRRPTDGDNHSINDCTFVGQAELLQPDKYNYTVSKDNTSCNLTVKSVRPSDSGCYQCDSWGGSGAEHSYVMLQVTERTRRVSLRQTRPLILENMPAEFMCSAGYGSDEVEIIWLLDGTVIPNGTATDALRRTEGGVDCMGRNETRSAVGLVLARHRAGSLLQCMVRGNGRFHTANLTIPDIQVPPSSILITDESTGKLFKTPGGKVLMEEHANASFTCLVKDTKPAARVTWLYADYPVSGTRGSVQAVSRPVGDGTADVNSTVVLPNIVWQDDGRELVCSATGAGGISVSLGIKIYVNAPPPNVTLTTGVIIEKTPAVFTCSAGPTRKASSITWYFNDILVTDAGVQTMSYSPEDLETTSALTMSLRKDQNGSRLRCEVQHESLNEPLQREEILDVYFCSSPLLSCPAILNTNESYTLTCRAPSSRPAANLSMNLEEPFRKLGVENDTSYEPGDDGGIAVSLTAGLTGDRRDHGKTVVCRRRPNEICRHEEADTCELNVYFPPSEVTLSDGSTSTGQPGPGSRIVEVVEGREYNFVCTASGSNPAAAFRWRIGTKELQGAEYTQTEDQQAGGGWSATSRLSLTARRDVHHVQKLTCDVLYPNVKILQQLSLELSVIAVTISGAMTIVIAVCSSVIVLVVVACLLVVFWKTRRHGNHRMFFIENPMELKQRKKTGTSKDSSNSSLTSCGVNGGLLEGSEAYEFPREKIQLLEVVGSGSFGLVYKATAEGIYEKGVVSTVAVKTPNPSGSSAEKEDFLKELEMFTVLVQHPNVVSMLGYCVKKDPVYLIMEYVANGNLENYLRQEKQRVDQSYVNLSDGMETIGSAQILTFAVQIVRGMKYLASVQCIHRDLATRNILLDENLVCKVSDFGLARHVPVQKQYEMKSQGRVPFRWMAPESILRNVYTTRSDVWSFGVLLWELVTLGSHPYPGLSCNEILENLRRGIRLQKPAHCSDEIYQLMTDCWGEIPEHRPDFEILHKRIEEMLANASGYLVMSNFSTEQYIYMAPENK